MPSVNNFQDKLTHLEEVARRAVATRQQMERAGMDKLDSRLTAHRVFRAVTVWCSGPMRVPVRAFQDTPRDIHAVGDELSRSWARQVRRTFVRAFISGDAATDALGSQD